MIEDMIVSVLQILNDLILDLVILLEEDQHILEDLSDSYLQDFIQSLINYTLIDQNLRSLNDIYSILYNRIFHIQSFLTPILRIFIYLSSTIIQEVFETINLLETHITSHKLSGCLIYLLS
jgi:hypothetical protein